MYDYVKISAISFSASVVLAVPILGLYHAHFPDTPHKIVPSQLPSRVRFGPDNTRISLARNFAHPAGIMQPPRSPVAVKNEYINRSVHSNSWDISKIDHTSLPHSFSSIRPSPLGIKELSALEDKCSPSVPESVLTSIVHAESNLYPLMIHVNRPRSVAYRPDSVAAAKRITGILTAAGADFDIGLAQINSKNFQNLNVSAVDMLDPCKNLSAAERLINQGYEAALHRSLPGRSVLETAYSFYNTGKAEVGFGNGYIEKIHSFMKASSF